MHPVHPVLPALPIHPMKKAGHKKSLPEGFPFGEAWLKEGGLLLSRIASQYHRRRRA